MLMRKYHSLSGCAIFAIVLFFLLAGTLITGIVNLTVGIVRGTADVVESIIHVSPDGVNIADLIIVDDSGVSVGGTRVDFEAIGDDLSEGLESVSAEVSQGMSGSFGDSAIDVSESDFRQNRYTFSSASNRSLDIAVQDCDIIIAAGDTDNLVVDVLESEDYHYTFTTKDGALTVKSPEESSTLTLFGLPIGKKEAVRYTGLAMVIYLPEAFEGRILCKTSGGDIKMGGLNLEDELQITTSGGKIELADIDAYEITALTSGARMKLSRLSADSLSFTTSGGRISMEDLTAKRLNAVTSGANIDFTRLFGEKFVLRTSGGDIDGSILGQESLFSIHMKTDGSAYPESKENKRAQYSLECVTAGGDIHVSFVE